MQKTWYAFSENGKRSAKKLLFVLTALFALTASSFAVDPQDLTQLPEATVQRVTKGTGGDQVQLGDRIPIQINIQPEWIKGEPTFQFSLPEGSSKLTEQGWYLDPNTSWVAGSIRAIVSPVKSGRLTLPMMIVKSKDQDFIAIARTQPFTVNVIASDKQSTDQPELIDPIEISLPLRFWVMGFLAFAALIVLGVFIYKKIKLRSKPEVAAPPTKIDEPEHVIALKRLEVLFKDNPYSSDAGKPIAFGTSEILKDFFSRRFKVEASEATSHEMLQLLKNVGVGTPELNEINDLFGELDQIKFVKKEHLPPYQHDMHQRISLKAHAMIHRWARQIEPQEKTPADRGRE